MWHCSTVVAWLVNSSLELNKRHGPLETIEGRFLFVISSNNPRGYILLKMYMDFGICLS